MVSDIIIALDSHIAARRAKMGCLAAGLPSSSRYVIVTRHCQVMPTAWRQVDAMPGTVISAVTGGYAIITLVRRLV